MKLSTWKQVVAVALTLEIAFAPALASARKNDPPPKPTVAELKDETYLKRFADLDHMLEHDELPEFTEDDTDPYAVGGQYTRIYNRDGKVIDQYFMDERALNRKRPAFTTIRPILKKNRQGQNCLVLSATGGEDANGKNGYVVAEVFTPRMCGIASIDLDNEVLNIVREDGRLSITNFGMVIAMAFKYPVWFLTNAWVPEPGMNLAGRKITAASATVGMKPFEPNEAIENAVIPFDPETGEERIFAGDLIMKADDKFVGAFSYEVSRIRLAIEQLRQEKTIALTKGNPKQVAAFVANLKHFEKRFGKFDELMNQHADLSTDPAVAAWVAEIGTDGHEEISRQVTAFMDYTKNKNDRIVLKNWAADYQKVVDGHTQFNELNKVAKPEVDPEEAADLAKTEAEAEAYAEELRLNWQNYWPKNHQSMAQRVATLNATGAAKFRSQIKSWTTIGAYLAGMAAFMAFPMAVEASGLAEKFAFINHLYNMSPDVLKHGHAGYRIPLFASGAFLTALTWAPDALSTGAALVLKGIDKATMGSSTRFAQGVRDYARFWTNQKTWQRIATAGAAVGIKLGVTPIIRIIENVLQQKALLSAARLHINPFKVIDPDSPVGRRLKLEKSETVGLVTPTLAGALKKMRRAIPGVEDRNSELWEKARLKHKLAIQGELHFQNTRRREYARLLATLAVAHAHGVNPVDVLTLMKSHTLNEGLIPNNKISMWMNNKRAQDETRLVTQMVDQEMKSFAHEFSTDPTYHEIDVASMAKYVPEAVDLAISLKRTEGYERFRKLAALNAKEYALNVWDKTLNQGRDTAEKLEGKVAIDDVWRLQKGEWAPDHIVVSDVPLIFNIPYLATRADFNRPDQLGADPHGFGWTSNVHMQDVIFNAISRLFQGPIQDMLQFQNPKPVPETRYQSRHDVANLVLRRNEGILETMLPVKTKDPMDLYDGFITEQSLSNALKTFWHTIKNDVNLGKQANNTMKSSYDTLWVYASLQMFARMVPGHQPFELALLGTIFMFQASPIFYKIVWWFTKPAVNGYRKNVHELEMQYRNGMSWLEEANLMPDSIAKTNLQKQGVDTLYDLLKSQAPEMLDRPELIVPLGAAPYDVMAGEYLQLLRRAPLGLLPNSTLVNTVQTAAAVFSTLGAIPMLVLATMPAFMTYQNVALFTAGSLAWQVFAINFFDKNSAARKYVKTSAEAVGRSLRATCDRALSFAN